MITRQTLLESIYGTVDQLNRQLPDGSQLEKAGNTVLTGEGGHLDSLGLINFIVALEQKLRDDFDAEIVLTSEEVLSGPDGHLKTIDSLTDYLLTQLAER
jgi:acyl carrier protein